MNKTVKKGLFPYVFLLIFIIGCLFIFNGFNQKVNELTTSEFEKYLTNGEVIELDAVLKTRTGNYQVTGKLESYKDNESFITTIPN